MILSENNFNYDRNPAHNVYALVNLYKQSLLSGKNSAKRLKDFGVTGHVPLPGRGVGVRFRRMVRFSYI